MNYYFQPDALHEYAEATEYYAAISPALANAFVTQIENGINQILFCPEAWPLIEEDVRRHLITRFPFGIYYTIENNTAIIIQAIMHLSRKPDYWKSRLR